MSDIVRFSKYMIHLNIPSYLKMGVKDYILITKRSGNKRICIMSKSSKIPSGWIRLKYGSDSNGNLKTKYIDYPLLYVPTSVKL